MKSTEEIIIESLAHTQQAALGVAKKERARGDKLRDALIQAKVQISNNSNKIPDSKDMVEWLDRVIEETK